MNFWKWGPKTILHNLAKPPPHIYFQKSLHPTLHSTVPTYGTVQNDRPAAWYWLVVCGQLGRLLQRPLTDSQSVTADRQRLELSHIRTRSHKSSQVSAYKIAQKYNTMNIFKGSFEYTTVCQTAENPAKISKWEQKKFVLLKLVAIYEGPPDDRKKAVKRCHNLAPALSFFAARTVQAFLLRAFLYLMICIRVDWCLWCEYKRRTGHLPNPLFKLTFYYFVCKGGKRPIFVESGNSVWVLPRVQITVFFSGPDNSVWVLTQVKIARFFGGGSGTNVWVLPRVQMAGFIGGGSGNSVWVLPRLQMARFSVYTFMT